MSPVLSLLIGAGMWGVSWYPMRVLEWHGLGGIWLILVIYTAALLASLPYTARNLTELFSQPRILIPLALTGGWTNTAFVLAVLDGNVMRVLLLFYLSPIWAVLFGWVLLREQVSRWSIAALALAMIGAMLLLWDPKIGMPWPASFSDWLALSSGFAFAVSNVLVRKGQGISIGAKSLAVWIGVVTVACALIVLFRLPPPAVTVPVALGATSLGIFGILVMTVLVQYGVTHMSVHRSAVILLFEIVTGAISQQLLTDEVMTMTDWAGGGLIVAAAYVSARLTK